MLSVHQNRFPFFGAFLMLQLLLSFPFPGIHHCLLSSLTFVSCQGECNLIVRDGRSELHGQYRGDMRHGTADGQGEAIWYDNNNYEGQEVGRYKGHFKGGAMHGWGTFTWSGSGDVYEGEWKRDKMHGQGEQRRGDGTMIHKGRWVNDEPQRNSVGNSAITGGLPLGATCSRYTSRMWQQRNRLLREMYSKGRQ
jgi:hypothetical protein